MREIKFRGRENDERYGLRWVYGDLTHNFGSVLVAGRIVEEFTVGQFTGIKDITGADIYESDIVSFKDDETDECVRGLVTHSVDGTWLVVCDGFSEYLSIVRKTTLIMGNVYDSPELLEADDARD